MTDRTVRIRITAELQDLQAKLRKGAADVKVFGNKVDQAIQKNRDKVNELSTSIGLIGGGMLGLSVLATRGFAVFDRSLSRIKAQGGEAAERIDDLRDAAVRAGADTQYSAAEAADAITALAKAGVSVQEILAGGLTGALALAASGEMDVAQAAEVTASALGQFELNGAAASHVSDLLAAGANKALGEVSDLSMALSQGGLVAHQTGLSIEETVGALSAFAQAGLLGSDAGTSLKTMLQRLTPQSAEARKEMDALGISAYDSQGNFVGLANFAGQLREKMQKLAPEARNTAMQVIFGADAVRAANVLYKEGKSGIDGWVKAVNDQGFAARQAATLTDNLAGDLERLGGSIDTVFIQSGSGANRVLRQLTQAADAAVDAFGQLPEPILNAGTLITGAGGIAVLGVAGMGKLAIATSDARAAMKSLGITSRAAKLAVGGVGTAVAIGTTALSIWAAKTAEASSNTADFASTLVVIDDRVVRTDATMTEFNKKLVESRVGMFNWMGAGPTITDTLAKMGLSAKDAQDYLEGNTEAVAKVTEAQDAYLAANWDKVSGWELSTLNLTGALDELKGNLTEAEKQTLEKAKADREAGVKAKTYAEAQSKVNTALAGGATEAQAGTSALKDYIEQLFRGANAALALSGSQRGFEGTLLDTAAATKKLVKETKNHNDLTDIHTKAGIAAKGILDQTATSTIAYTSKLMEQNKSQKEINAAMERGREAFAKQARAMGYTETQIANMIAEYNLVPDSVNTEVSADGTTTAAAELSTLKDALKGLPDKVKSRVLSEFNNGGVEDAYTALAKVDQETADAWIRTMVDKHGVNWWDNYDPRDKDVYIRTHTTKGAAPRGNVKKATGGLIGGFSPTPMADDKIIAATSGEYMQQVSAVRYYGTDVMDALNARRIPREALEGYAGGGAVGALQPTPYLSSVQVNSAPQVVAGPTFHVSSVTYYPVAEPQSVATNRDLQRAAALGII